MGWIVNIAVIESSDVEMNTAELSEKYEGEYPYSSECENDFFFRVVDGGTVEILDHEEGYMNYSRIYRADLDESFLRDVAENMSSGTIILSSQYEDEDINCFVITPGNVLKVDPFKLISLMVKNHRDILESL